jgi:hypothetical protein
MVAGRFSSARRTLRKRKVSSVAEKTKAVPQGKKRRNFQAALLIRKAGRDPATGFRGERSLSLCQRNFRQISAKSQANQEPASLTNSEVYLLFELCLRQIKHAI